MKICFFTENYHKGGLDTFLINLFNSWPNSRDELTLVCNSSHPGIETIKSKARRFVSYRLYSRVFTSSISKGNTIFWSANLLRLLFSLSYKVLQYPVLFPWYVISLAVFFRNRGFDRLMVVNGGYPASLLCRCAAIAWGISGKRRKATFNFHNSATRSPWYYSWPEYFIDRLVINSSEIIIAVSKNCLDSLCVREAFLGGGKFKYIYNGIEDPIAGLDARESSRARTDGVRYCLMLATYEPRKGHLFLLQAFRLVANAVPDVRLRIYGFGSFEQKKAVADEVVRLSLENRVFLNDFTAITGPLLANASVLVVPSQAYESFGLTIVEAMAFGTPVVTTDVGGMPEVLADSGAGYVCSKDSVPDFADAIMRILDDPLMAADLGKRGRHAFEKRFTSLNMAQCYQSIISGQS